MHQTNHCSSSSQRTSVYLAAKTRMGHSGDLCFLVLPFERMLEPGLNLYHPFQMSLCSHSVWNEHRLFSMEQRLQSHQATRLNCFRQIYSWVFFYFPIYIRPIRLAELGSILVFVASIRKCLAGAVFPQVHRLCFVRAPSSALWSDHLPIRVAWRNWLWTFPKALSLQ